MSAIKEGAVPLPPADLAALVRRFWQSDPEGLVMSDSPVVTTFGELPATHRPVEVYVVVPHLQAPRFLVPAGNRQAVTAALAHDVVRPAGRPRLAGRAAAAGWWTGAAEPMLRTRLTVGVDRRVPERMLREWLLLRRLSSRLRHEVAAVLPVPPASAVSRPVAQLIDRSGVAQGHLEVGWSPFTRRLVRNEGRVLWALRGRAGEVIAPRLRDAGSWQGADYIVTAPLPPVRRLRPPPEQMSRMLASLSGALGPEVVGAPRPVDLRGYLRSVEGRLAESSSAEPAASAALAGLAARIRRSGAPVPLGRWHGDWLPGNVGRGRSGPVAWGWAHSDGAVPVGFDLLHWHFHDRLDARGATLADAVAGVYAAAPLLGALGVPEPARDVVATTYLLEILTRATHAAAHGADWDPRLHPDVLRVVDDVAAAGAAPRVRLTG